MMSAIPQYASLRQAFQDPGTLGVDFTLSPPLLEMFKRQSADVDHTSASRRFHDARAIYNSIAMHNPPHSVFYAIDDYEKTLSDYPEVHDLKTRGAIRDYCDTCLADPLLRRLPTLAEFTRHITHLRDTSFTEAESNLYDFYLTSMPTLYPLVAANRLEHWFKDPHIITLVREVAINSFYRVPNWRTAKESGLIYTPTDHNWGVNAAWLLGIIDNGKPVISLSKVNLLHRNRAPLWGPSPFPSAFSLEIAMILTAGYSVHYTQATGNITFNPPALRTALDTTGQEGSGLVPTRMMQLVLYQELMSDIDSGHDLTNWKPALAPIAAALTAASGDPASLTNYVTQACTAPSDLQKQNFINALEIMRRSDAEGLRPILERFSLADHTQLGALLGRPPFATNAIYDDLRREARPFEVRALATNLETQRIMQVANFRTWFHHVCTIGNINARRDLADVLDHLGCSGVLPITLGSLTSTEHRALSTMLNIPPFAGNPAYNALRAEAKCAQLAAHLESRRTTDATDFRAWFNTICIFGSPDAKQNLAETLSHLGYRGVLPTTLDSLTLREHRALRTMLTTPPFAGNQIYAAMRALARSIEVAALAANLETQRTTNAAHFITWFRGVCDGTNSGEKRDLVDALDHLGRSRALPTTLGNLTLTEHQGLRTVLTTPPFAANPTYDDLRRVARSAESAELANDLENRRNHDVNAFRTWVSDRCRDWNTGTRRDLADALRAIDQRGTLRTTLDSLTPREHEALRMMLTTSPFAGDHAYNGLRASAAQVAEAARQRSDPSGDRDPDDRAARQTV